MEVTNIDIYNEFIALVRSGASDEAILREFGGSNLYIPSFKRIFRDIKIKEAHANGVSVKAIARDFMLSTNRVYEILSKK